MTVEAEADFSSLQAWLDWSAGHGSLLEAAAIDALGRRIQARGVREPLTARLATDLSAGTDWREGLIDRGVNSRMRAVLKVIERLPAMPPPDRMQVYAPEALSDFAARLRALYPHFRGSEFHGAPPIAHEDLCRLSMATASLDLVVTNDVLEHVADLDAALGEIARVLRPGGWHVGTHPFLFACERSLVRARLEDGEVRHLLDPEYHEDPLDPAGVLVFEVPGWDILERCRAAGFARAVMRYVLSEAAGCLSADAGGIFVLLAQK